MYKERKTDLEVLKLDQLQKRKKLKAIVVAYKPITYGTTYLEMNYLNSYHRQYHFSVLPRRILQLSEQIKPKK